MANGLDWSFGLQRGIMWCISAIGAQQVWCMGRLHKKRGVGGSHRLHTLGCLDALYMPRSLMYQGPSLKPSQ
jgi:hypothetical protein